MVSQITQLGNGFSPYVPLPGISTLSEDDANSSALRSMLLDRTIRQVDLMISHINRDSLEQMPLVVRSMALENHNTLLTILNMLLAYKDFLTSHIHADVREKLAAVFLPMEAWVFGQNCITSPALLIVQSILYSHSEWFREELFEAHPAIRTYEELELLGFPDMHCYFIAAIVSHQTLLRASWSSDVKNDPRETLAFFYDNKQQRFVFAQEKEQDSVLGLALGKTLFEFIGQKNNDRRKQDPFSPKRPNILHRQLAASLIFHALCLQCRHSRNSSNDILPNIKKKALEFLDHLLATERSHKFERPSLAFIHYGRYIYQAQREAGLSEAENLFNKAITWIEDEISMHGNAQHENDQCNISFCFQRVSTKKVWYSVREIKPGHARRFVTKKEHNKDYNDFNDIDNNETKGIKTSENEGFRVFDLVIKTVGYNYWKQEVDDTEYLLSSLGLELDSNNNDHVVVKNEINAWLSVNK